MESEERLFDVFERTDMKPASHTEPTFRFRNRSGWEASSEVRRLLESIYARYPSAEREHLRRRFRSDQDRHHEGALLELLFFAILQAHTVKVNADTPDFEFTSRGDPYGLEAKAFDEHGTSGPLEGSVFDTIEKKLSSSDYFLSISPRGELSCMPRDELFIDPIQELLDTPREAWQEATARREIELDDYSEGTYRLDVRLWLKSTDAPDHRLIGARAGTWGWLGAEEIEWGARLLRGLERKARKLRSRLEPSYLAVSVPTDLLPSPQPIALRALYGTSSETRVSGLTCLWERQGEVRNQHIKGVVVCGKILPQALDHPEVTCSLYMAPGAEQPPEPLCRLPRVWLDGDTLRGQPGEKLGALVRDGLRL